MGQIDYPLLDGVHEENDNKLSKPSSLITAANVYYDLIGRMCLRGGIVGSSNDGYTTSTYGAARASVETPDGLIVATDLGSLVHSVDGAMAGSFLSGMACCERDPVSIPLGDVDLTGVAPLSVAGTCTYAKAGTLERIATRASYALRSSEYSPWTYTAGGAATDDCSAQCLVKTTSYGDAILCATPSDIRVELQSGSTITLAKAGVITSCDCIPYGSGGIFVYSSGANIYVCLAWGNTLVQKFSFAHGVTASTPRVRVGASGTVMWIAYLDTSVSPVVIRALRFAIPANPTDAWSSTTTATDAASIAARAETLNVEFDITAGGYLVFSGATTPGSAYTLGSFIVKRNCNSATEIAWNSDTSGAYVFRPGASMASKLFQVTGQAGYFFFAITAPYPEPLNAMVLMRVSPSTANAVYDGEVVSVSDVLQAPLGKTSYYGTTYAPYVSRGVNPLPFVTGTDVYFLRYAIGQGDAPSPRLSRWDTVPKRSLAQVGSQVISSAATHGRWVTGEIPGLAGCFIWSMAEGVFGGAAIPIGTYYARALVEVETPDGVWQSAASLPVSAAITASTGRCLSVQVDATALPFRKTQLTWRVVVYVAPPGSTVYYRAATADVDRQGTFLTHASYSVTIPTVPTSTEILYELSEPARIYPGDASVVGAANGRLFRARGDTLWFTHQQTNGIATQWAGDVLMEAFPSEVQGIGQLQGQPVIICADSIWLLGGDGPDRTGAGKYDRRQIASVPLGCQDQRSVIETPAGLCWTSCRGIEMIPAGGGPPVSIGQPVRVSTGNYPHTLGAHVQSRSLAVWFSDSGFAVAGSVAVCFDYLRGVWFTWKLEIDNGYITAAGSWSNSFAVWERDPNGTTYAAFDAKVREGALGRYPQYSCDSIRGSLMSSLSATIETGDVRVSGTNTRGIWGPLYALGAAAQSSSIVTLSAQQTADGTQQATQSGKFSGTVAEQSNFRLQVFFPVSDADAISARILFGITSEVGPGYYDPGPPSLTSLTFTYEPTPNLSLTAAANRS